MLDRNHSPGSGGIFWQEVVSTLRNRPDVIVQDYIVGVGGGSALDLAKLVAVLFDGRQKTLDIIGIGKVTGRNVQLISVATTAGTGSEVTPIAILTDTQAKLKKGVVSQYLIPDIAIVGSAGANGSEFTMPLIPNAGSGMPLSRSRSSTTLLTGICPGKPLGWAV